MDGQLGIWRRRGDTAYAFLSLAIFTLEALALTVLTWVFVLRLARVVPPTLPEGLLTGVVISTACVLLLLSGYVLGNHVFSERDSRNTKAQLEGWTDRWIRVLFEGEEPPEAPLSRAAIEALLNLRDVLRGADAARLCGLFGRYGIEANLLAKLRSSRVTTRLEAIEDLARARLPGAFHPLLAMLSDPHVGVRLMAARASSRTLASMLPGPDQDQAAAACAHAMRWGGLPGGVVQEALLLLDEAAPPVLRHLMNPEVTEPGVLGSAIEAAGRLALLDLRDEILSLATHDDPEIRAASFRALTRLGVLPPRGYDVVVAALSDDVDFVRIQATRAASLLPPSIAMDELWAALSDRSWWARKAAAESMLRFGERGIAALVSVVETHPDRYGREMARQVLLDANVLGPETAQNLEGVA